MMSVRKRWRWLSAIPLLLVPVLVYAQSTHVFRAPFGANTVISSSAVNDTFLNLDDRVRALEAGIPWTKITGVPIPIRSNNGNINIGGGPLNDRTLFGGNGGGGNMHIDANATAAGTAAGFAGLQGRVYFNWYTGNGVAFGDGKAQASANGTTGQVVANITSDGVINAKAMLGTMPSDVAENLIAAETSIEAGDVVSVALLEEERLVRTRKPYDPAVLGVISTRPGVLLNNAEPDNKPNPNHRPLALVGRVPVKVTLEGGPIEPGDLLTSSSTPGYAMKAEEPWRGGIIGVALGRFGDAKAKKTPATTGRVVVFLNLHPAPTVNPHIVDELAAANRALENQVTRFASVEARLRAMEKQLAALSPGGTRLAEAQAP